MAATYSIAVVGDWESVMGFRLMSSGPGSVPAMCKAVK